MRGIARGGMCGSCASFDTESDWPVQCPDKDVFSGGVYAKTTTEHSPPCKNYRPVTKDRDGTAR